MTDEPSSPDVLTRTFADHRGEYRYTAIAWSRAPTAEWHIRVVGAFVSTDGGAELDEPMTMSRPVLLDRRPTLAELHEAIGECVSDRGRDCVETSDVSQQLNELLRVNVGAVAYSLSDPGLAETETFRHACHVARVLTLGTPAEVSEAMSVVLQYACGEHPAPTQKWLNETPLGSIAIRSGLAKRPQPTPGEPMKASVAAQLLGERGPSAIVQLINEGALARHAVGGVDSKSVRALLDQRDEERNATARREMLNDE